MTSRSPVRDTSDVTDDPAVRRELMTFRAHLEGRDVTTCIQDLVSSATASDIHGVNTAILQHAQDFAWVSTLESLATLALEDVKDELAGYEADALSGMDEGETVTQAKAKMKSQAGWKELRDRVRRAERQLSLIRVGRKTCEENKSALSEVARNLRAEMERLLNVRAPASVNEADRRMREQFGRDRAR
mgnify:CR=1 FL=1